MYRDEPSDRRPDPVRRRLVLIALCVAVVFMCAPYLRAIGRHGPRQTTIGRMKQIHDALVRYAVDNGGQVPSTEQGLRALLVEPQTRPRPTNWCGPYVDDPRLVFDGWGHRLHYLAPGSGAPRRPYDLWSLGSDNARRGGGSQADIKFWEPETLTP